MRSPAASGLTESEAFVIAPLLFAAALILLSWCAGLTGVPVAPWPLTALALLGSLAACGWMSAERLPFDRWRLAGLVILTLGSAGYVCWLAWPHLLPITDGPDLIHHLTLIHFIQHRHALPRDPVFSPYLAEMRAYTPGSHLLAAVVADVLRTDAARVIHPLMALAVGLRAGITYNTILRLVPGTVDRLPRAAAALAGALLLFVPYPYLLQPVVWFGFYSQVVAETFAIAMLWGLVAWYQQPSQKLIAVIAGCGLAVELCWPVLIGPPMAAMAAVVLLARSTWVIRVSRLALAAAPAAIVTAVHSIANPAGAGILHSGGSAVNLSVNVFGWAFIGLASSGVVLSALRFHRHWPLLAFAGASLGQVAALAVLQARLGATNPYFAMKTMHLVVDAAVLFGGVAIGGAVAWLMRTLPRRAMRSLSWLAPVLVLTWIWNTGLPRKPMQPFITPAVWQAGTWAKEHLPASCIEYLVRHWQTGYWLHFDLLGNPRVGPRLNHETFVLRDNLGLWIMAASLPYAIVEDVTDLPREATEHTRILQRVGRAAVIERSDGLGKCEDRTPAIDEVVSR